MAFALETLIVPVLLLTIITIVIVTAEGAAESERRSPSGRV
jgi:hypothetical protein